MVLWYDISRQGATNESMITNPILKDLSGNGNDATCYNFAWSGMSGIGGYGQPLSSYNNIKTDRATFEFDGLTTKIKSITIRHWQIYNKVTGNTAVAAQRIRVTGVPSGIQIHYQKRDKDSTTTRLLNITEDGVYYIPQFNVDDIYGIEIIQTIANCDITIEQLPLYPNTLVSDGVDDYVMVQNKYVYNFNTEWKINPNIVNYTITNSKITITNINSENLFLSMINTSIKAFSFKVSGNFNGNYISLLRSDGKNSITITEEGVYNVIADDTIVSYFAFFVYIGDNGGACNITIEQLSINKSLILTKEQGFTVLAKRKWISDINSKSQGLATKGTSVNWIDGAFYFEGVEGNGSSPFNRVFDNSNGQRGANYIRNFTENDITYLTSKEYNGSPLKNIGDAVDTDMLVLFKLPSTNPTLLSSIALYSFILFDRDLTDDEIDWVKYNLLGEKKPEFDKSLVDGWFFNGTNDNFPNTIAGINGNEMVLYGFDGTVESGFNNGLQFDGIDDYTKVSGLPILDDFTLICHREILQSTNYEVASKAEVWNNGAFQLEMYSESNGGGRSYGGQTGYCNIDVSEQVVYMTPTYYKGNNGTKTFNKGTGIDTEYLWLGKVRDADDITTKMNIKYFLLYNKTLTEEEIQSEIEKAEKKFLE